MTIRNNTFSGNLVSFDVPEGTIEPEFSSGFYTTDAERARLAGLGIPGYRDDAVGTASRDADRFFLFHEWARLRGIATDEVWR